MHVYQQLPHGACMLTYASYAVRRDFDRLDHNPEPAARLEHYVLRRLAQLTVRTTTAPDCWAALPAALMSRLLDSGAPMPLVLELRPAGPSGAFNVI